MYFNYIRSCTRVSSASFYLKNGFRTSQFIANNFITTANFEKSSFLFPKWRNKVACQNIIQRPFTDATLTNYNFDEDEKVSLMKSLLNENQKEEAEKMLALMTFNNECTNYKHFNVIMRSYAMIGDIDNCFRLYKKMKSLNIDESVETYTILLTAIGNHNDPHEGMAFLSKVMKLFQDNGVTFNMYHYSAMIKIYDKFNKPKKAFEIFGEMLQKNIDVNRQTFYKLFHASCHSINDGMKLSLILWHTMRILNVMPDIKIFHFLLRSMFFTYYDDLKIHDSFSINRRVYQIKIIECGKSNLLAPTPVISKESLLEIDPSLARSIRYDSFTHYLNDIHSKNKLSLFGGFENILQIMEKYYVFPNSVTFTYFILLESNSDFLENTIINTAKKMKVDLKLDFFNALIKKRCNRRDYESAKDVLMLIQNWNLKPTIDTWNALALSCKKAESIEKFFYDMETAGFKPNDQIIQTIISNLTRNESTINFLLIIELMKYMQTHQIIPSQKTLDLLSKISSNSELLIMNKDTSLTPIFKESFQRFNHYYKRWITPYSK